MFAEDGQKGGRGWRSGYDYIMLEGRDVGVRFVSMNRAYEADRQQ